MPAQRRLHGEAGLESDQKGLPGYGEEGPSKRRQRAGNVPVVWPGSWGLPSRTVGHLAREGPCFLLQTPALHPELHPPEPVRLLHPASTVRLHQGRGPQVDVQHGRPAAPVGRAPLLPGVCCDQEALGWGWMVGEALLLPLFLALGQERQELPSLGPQGAPVPWERQCPLGPCSLMRQQSEGEDPVPGSSQSDQREWSGRADLSSDPTPPGSGDRPL